MLYYNAFILYQILIYLLLLIHSYLAINNSNKHNDNSLYSNESNTIRTPLNAKWEFKMLGKYQPNEATDITISNITALYEWMPAIVPGTVHTDLWNNKLIDDPYYGNHEKIYQWIEFKDWVYRTTFDIPESIFNKSYINLVFYGIDTHAVIKLNEYEILNCDNMFTKWTSKIKRLINLHNNTLEITFYSSVNHDQKLNLEFFLPSDNSRIWSRKAAYHYGWDWGPRYVTCGIWQPIYLESFDYGIIEDINIITTSLNENFARLKIQVETGQALYIGYIVRVEDLNNPMNMKERKMKALTVAKNINLELEIEKPVIWWPRGYGQQYMYSFRISLLTNDTKVLIDTKIQEIGLRTIEIIQEDDTPDDVPIIYESFVIKVNGIDMFMKGANYIPPSMFMPSVTLENYTHIIETAKESNYNMLRVWGGGNYENDIFYELCDRNGMLIWHDFMFANGMYPGNQSYLNSITNEINYQVKRLKNHPSIGLWCGNNEILEGWNDWGYSFANNSNLIWSWYIKIFEDIIPNTIRQYDHYRFYTPSSPRHGWLHQESYVAGDSHYWGVWHGFNYFNAFELLAGRFISEFGIQAGPDMNTMKKYTKANDRWINGTNSSEVMLIHQKNSLGYYNLQYYIEFYHNSTLSFEYYIYLTQIVQAQGIQIAIESYRRNMPYTMGCLYWQLNDVWPVFSWSSMDYYGNWKALQWRVKKYYQDVIISVKETQFDLLEVYIISDRLMPFTGILEMKVMDMKGNMKCSVEVPVLVTKGSKIMYHTSVNEIFDMKIINNETLFNYFMLVTLKANINYEQNQIFEHLFYFCIPKFLRLEKPIIDITCVEEKVISLRSNVLVKDLYLFVDDAIAKVKFSDNFFDLYPNQLKLITLTCEGDINAALNSIVMYDLYHSTRQSQPLNAQVKKI